MNSPWGIVQQNTPIVPGVRWVSTAGHGGYICARQWAEMNLSEHAREGALRHDDSYCYEEDCDYAIVEWESAEVAAARMQQVNSWGGKQYTSEEWVESLRNSLERWNPHYLVAYLKGKAA